MADLHSSDFFRGSKNVKMVLLSVLVSAYRLHHSSERGSSILKNGDGAG